MKHRKTAVSDTDIAIVGMSCRFPSANTPDEFWNVICEGEEQLTHFSETELRRAGIADELIRDPNYVPVTSLIDSPGHFDAAFFGITPREAEMMDPQHRLFLELCWLALEDAGCRPQMNNAAIGVFVGAARNMYLRNNINPFLDASDHLDGSVRGLQADIGNYGDFLATRVSYKLGLHGPSLNVQTACSTSLVAVHLACQSLSTGESDVALAGGVAILSPQVNGYLYEEGSISSSDGHCRPFDEKANGTVFGNGAGVVVLKRLQDAIDERDRVIAVVKGTAINNDGAEKMSYSAPSVPGQARVIVEAQRMGDIDPSTIGMIEAHGTGTSLGDPIEIAALTEAFGLAEVEEPFCAVTAVKGQIGHLGAAAGIAGFMKAALAVERGKIPPCVNFSSPNPGLDLDASPFYISDELREWRGLRRAGVSSFGIGGTNAHAVLESFEDIEVASSDLRNVEGKSAIARRVPIVVSAKSPQALSSARQRLAEHLEGHRDLVINDVAWTLVDGRSALEHRSAFFANSIEETIQLLRNKSTSSIGQKVGSPRIVFAFPGQGSHFKGMGTYLYSHDDLFRGHADDASAALLRIANMDVRRVLFGMPNENDGDLLSQTAWAQPALFVIEYALARSLIDRGVKPDVLIGHSVGEFTAACIAEVFSLDDAVLLLSTRARLMQQTAQGAMLAVRADEETLGRFMSDELDLAAVNGPEQCVVAGSMDGISALQDELTASGIANSSLAVERAFHSRLMDPILEAFRGAAESIMYSYPSMNVISNVTGGIAEPGLMATSEYWVRHLREPVRFGDGASSAIDDRSVVVIELGPGRALSGMFKKLPNTETCRTIESLMPDVEGTTEDLLARLWECGADVDLFVRLEKDLLPRRVSLPGYPFERKAYWIEPPRVVSRKSISETNDVSVTDSWLAYREWLPAPIGDTATESGHPAHMLFVGAPSDRWLADQLQSDRTSVEFLTFDQMNSLTLSESQGASIEMIGESFCDTVVFLQGRLDGQSHDDTYQIATSRFLASARLVDKLVARAPDRELNIVAIRRAPESDDGDIVVDPLDSLVAGVLRVAPQEYANVASLELEVDEAASKNLAAILNSELMRPDRSDAEVVLYRSGERLVSAFARTTVDTNDETLWRPNGKYLLTGGLGGIALALAKDASKVDSVTLVLVSRSKFPPMAQWEKLARNNATSERLLRQVNALQALVDAGATLHVVSADVSDEDAMRRIRQRYGPFDGIVHCAGVPGGSLLSNTSAEQVLKVTSPKVLGTLILDEVVAEDDTWMLLCSSMSAILGGLGQGVYCAANAFLDAYALWRNSCGRRTISIGFDAWGDVGMAVETASTSGSSAMADQSTFEWRRSIATRTDWVVSEHRIASQGVVPGTAIIEFIRAAATEFWECSAVTISELDILKPVITSDDQSKELRVIVCDDEAPSRVTLLSRSEGTEWTEHVHALVSPTDAKSRTISFTALDAVPAVEPWTPASDVVQFGPRWRNLGRTLWLSNEELLVECVLPDEFADDSKEFVVHPALLDTVLGAFLVGKNLSSYLPISCEEIVVFAPMTSHIVGRAHLMESTEDFMRFDLDIANADGRVVMAIRGQTLRSVESDEKVIAAQLKNRSLVSGKPGDLDHLQFNEAERRVPGHDEIEIKVLATGMNFKEVLIASGMLDLAGPDYEFGLECAGEVTAVGSSITEFKIGDPVMAFARGAFSEFVVTSARLASHVPFGMTFEQAATIPVVYGTAYDCLANLAHLAKGERVLVHSAAGGVGLAAMYVARHLGATILATAGTESKRELLRELGAELVMDSRSTDFEMAVNQHGGADVVLNSLGGDRIPAGMRCLRPMGRFIEIGKRDILAGIPLDLSLFERGITFSSYNPDLEGDAFAACWSDVASLVTGGQFPSIPLRSFSIDDIVDAFRYMARGQHVGKVVVTRVGADQISLYKPQGESDSDGLTTATAVPLVRRAFAFRFPHLVMTPRDVMSRKDDLLIANSVLRSQSTTLAENSRPSLKYDYVTPLSSTEQKLSAVWAALLGIEPVGRLDRFLDLGGDSLSATQVVAKVKNEMSVRISPADVLRDQPLSALAENIDAKREASSAEAENDNGTHIEVGSL